MREAILASIAVALAIALIFAVTGDDAAEEREARIAAEERAQAADDSLAKLWTAWRADSVEDARADSIADAAIAEAEERARVAEASANARTERFRRTLTREQQAELDGITAFWQETVRELESATEELRGKLARAEGDAADNLALALEEQRRADRWRESYEIAKTEIDALRRPDFFSLDLDDVPKIAAALTVGYLAGR